MTTYKAKKGNQGFYIQPEMIEDYAKLGYKIVKLEEVVITDVESEIQSIEENKGTIQSIGKAVTANG